jgi:hypothetical protein
MNEPSQPLLLLHKLYAAGSVFTQKNYYAKHAGKKGWTKV